MDNGIQLARLPQGDNLFCVIVDGVVAGRLENLGDSVIWRPWFMAGSMHLAWSEFGNMMRRRN